MSYIEHIEASIVFDPKYNEIRDFLNIILELENRKFLTCRKILKIFLKMGHSRHSRPLFLYFCLICILIVQLVDKILPMTGFKPWISGVGSDRSTN